MHILNDFFAIIMMLFLIMTGSDNLSKQQILTLVQDNHEYLQECVDAKDYEKAEEISGIKSVHSSSWSEDSYVEFYCGGAGIVPSSSYYGFYFSPGDVPLAVDVTQTKKLRPDGNGFAWQEKWERSDGDNSYYTERIMECWYYYESHF